MYGIFLSVLIVSIQFIGLFVIRMRMEILKATVVRYPCLFRLFNCGTIKNKEAFKKAHMLSNITFENELKIKPNDV